MLGPLGAVLATTAGRRALALIFALALVGGALAWLRWDAAQDARRALEAERLEEIHDAIKRARPGPVVSGDDCRERLRRGEPCAD